MAKVLKAVEMTAEDRRKRKRLFVDHIALGKGLPGLKRIRRLAGGNSGSRRDDDQDRRHALVEFSWQQHQLHVFSAAPCRVTLACAEARNR